MSDITTASNNLQQPPAKGEPQYLPCCEICGDTRGLKVIEITHGGLLRLCKACRRLFFADVPEVGGEDGR